MKIINKVDYSNYLYILSLYGISKTAAEAEVQCRFRNLDSYVEWNPETQIFSSRYITQSPAVVKSIYHNFEKCWRQYTDTVIRTEEQSSNMPETRLKELRKSKGMTQAALAKKAGLYPRIVQKIERGEVDANKVSYSHIARLAYVLRVKPEELFVPAPID